MPVASLEMPSYACSVRHALVDPCSEHGFLSKHFLDLCRQTQFLSGFCQWTLHFAQKSFQNLSEHLPKDLGVLSKVLDAPGP